MNRYSNKGSDGIDPSKRCANIVGDTKRICFEPAVVRKRVGWLTYPLCAACAETITSKTEETKTLKLEGSKNEKQNVSKR